MSFITLELYWCWSEKGLQYFWCVSGDNCTSDLCWWLCWFIV